jgi:hypothetical protein
MPDKTPPEKLQVFLCHSSGDKAEVRALYQRLQAEAWLHPWLDEEELIPGQDWRDEIEQAVEKSHVIVVCLTPASINKEGFVQYEIRVALEHAEYMPEGTIYIIPLKLKPVEEVPRRLKRWQWANYYEDNGHERLLKGLRLRAEKLGMNLTPAAVPPPPSPASAPATEPAGANNPEHLQKLLTEHRRRLEVLELQRAGFGDLYAPSHLITQIEDVQKEISRLEGELRKVADPPQPAPAPPKVSEVKPAPTPRAEPPKEPEADGLLRELQDLKTTHQRRLEIGKRLDAIGDPRPGVGLRPDGLPDIEWLPVAPGGQIKIAGQNFNVQPFYLAKYPITYVQYQAFVNTPDGYNNPEWWQDFPEEYRPQKLDGQEFKGGNNPRDSVSWYQSVAFARWLNSKLEGWLFPDPGNAAGAKWVIGQGVEVRLPAEWEWQWAAQGGKEQRAYPWGKWQEGYANTKEAGLEQTVAVGLYPPGAAKGGAMDMSGQVSEWCLNKGGKPEEVRADDSGEGRVLRGGSFFSYLDLASCAYRGGFFPGYFGLDWGFRVVVGAALSRL